ncbi:MAG: MFS transporter, partial [Mariniphaga sp.]|nr:MFS transporter [Mariniphaga sp.]
PMDGIINGIQGAKGLGIDATIAGTVVGTYWFLMLIGRLFGGFLGSKFSSKAMLTFVSSLGIMFILLAIFSPVSTTVNMPVFQSDLSFGLINVPIGVMFFVFCGLCTSIMWGGIFNLAVEGLGKYTTAASGIFMVMVCGGGIIPLLQGYVADITSYMGSYWVILACLAYMLFYALMGSRNVNKDIVVA